MHRDVRSFEDNLTKPGVSQDLANALLAGKRKHSRCRRIRWLLRRQMRPCSLDRHAKPGALGHRTETYEDQPATRLHAIAYVGECLDRLFEKHDAKTRIHQIRPTWFEGVSRGIGKS